jgi:endonuclease/exonuclease/phosphatase family metal-dependent hydrolase
VVHSAHLYPFPDGEVRLREIKEMLASMQADLKAGRSMLLMGDLNHRPLPPEYKLWTDAGWIDTFRHFEPGPGHKVATIPYGGGKTKTLVKNAYEPDWSL